MSAARERFHAFHRDVREIYVDMAKWTVYLLLMAVFAATIVVIEVTLLDSQSNGDQLVQLLRVEHARDQQNTAKFASNQEKMLDFQALQQAKMDRILNFVRTHPGKQIPARLLTEIPPPVLQKIATPGASGTKKAVPPKGRKAQKRNVQR